MQTQQLDLRSFFRLNIMRGEFDYTETPVQGDTDELMGQAGICNTPLESREPLPPPHVGVHPKIDGITFLYNCSNVRHAIVLMYEIWGVTYNENEIREDAKYNQNWFALQGSWGCRMDYRADDAGAFRVRISISGERCSSLDLADIQTAMLRCKQLSSFCCSRIDCNADDTTGTLDLDRIAELARTGGYARYEVTTCIQSYGGTKAGQSVIFGGEKSLQKVIFYDKSAESEGRIEGVRQELRLRGGKANQAYSQLCFCGVSEVSVIIKGWLAGCILLGEKSDANLSRFKLADFWEQWILILNSPPTRPPQPVVKSSIQRSLKWLERATAKALAVAQCVFNQEQFQEFMSRLLEKGLDSIPESLIPEMVQFTEQRCYVEFGL